MTTLTLKLSDEMVRKLRLLAERKGRDPTAVALDIVEQWLKATVPSSSPSDLPYEEWKRLFDEWVSSHPQIDVVLDDGRETIYEGR